MIILSPHSCTVKLSCMLTMSPQVPHWPLPMPAVEVDICFKTGLELQIITTFDIRNSVLRSSCVIPLAREGLASVHRIVEDTVFLFKCRQ